MKNNKVKTVLGASLLAAALTAQAQSHVVSEKTLSQEVKKSHEKEATRNDKHVDPEAKKVFIKDLSKKVETMAHGSKTEIVEK